MKESRSCVSWRDRGWLSAAQQNDAAAAVLAAVVFSGTRNALPVPMRCWRTHSGRHRGGSCPPPAIRMDHDGLAPCSFVPYGEPAWRINLSSAVCGSIALPALRRRRRADLVRVDRKCRRRRRLPLHHWCGSIRCRARSSRSTTSTTRCCSTCSCGTSASCASCAPAPARRPSARLRNQHIVFFCAPYALWALGVGGALATPRPGLPRAQRPARSAAVCLPALAMGPMRLGARGRAAVALGFLTHVLRRYGTCWLTCLTRSTTSTACALAAPAPCPRTAAARRSLRPPRPTRFGHGWLGSLPPARCIQGRARERPTAGRQGRQGRRRRRQGRRTAPRTAPRTAVVTARTAVVARTAAAAGRRRWRRYGGGGGSKRRRWRQGRQRRQDRRR